MESDSRVLRDIGLIINHLANGLDSDDLMNGWGEESRMNYLAFFRELEARALRGDDLSDVISISRSMDHWGITGGRTAELAARISVALRNSR